MNIDAPRRPTPSNAWDAPLVVGVELGGTKIICTLGTGPDMVIASERIATGEPEPTLKAIEAVLDDWIRTYPRIAALGFASFGPLDLDPASPTYGSIVQTSKPGWSGTDVYQRMQRRYGLPMGFDTDVNGAALAEGRWGAAQDLDSWIYITIGTGVGAGIIIANQPVSGLGHSEAGHMLVRREEDDTTPGICPYHGDCVEGLISGPAIAARAGTHAEALPPDHPVWDFVCETIAAMLHNLVTTSAPQRIILGGGVIERRPNLFPSIRQKLIRDLAGYAHAAAIEQTIDQFVVPPALGSMAGPNGALVLALDAAALHQDA